MIEFSTLKAQVIKGDDFVQDYRLNWIAIYKLSAVDILAIHNAYIRCKNDHEKKVFAKLLCSNAYEFLNDLTLQLGKHLEWHVEMLNSETLLISLTKLRLLLKQIKKNFQNDLQLVRNKVGSHKDNDYLLQLKVTNSIKYGDVDALMITLYVLIISLQKFETEFLHTVKAYADTIGFLPKDI